MKTVAFRRTPADAVSVPPAVDLIADSAVVTAGRPLFLPDFSEAWEARLYIALRIGRLGKDVAEKFAARYIDGITLALRLVPAGYDDAPHSVAGLFDNCLALGQWIPLSADDKENLLVQTLTVTCGEMSATVTPGMLRAAETVAAVTLYATVKTGDVVLPCRLPVAFPASAGMDVTATLEPASIGNPVLSTRIR